MTRFFEKGLFPSILYGSARDSNDILCLSITTFLKLLNVLSADGSRFVLHVGSALGLKFGMKLRALFYVLRCGMVICSHFDTSAVIDHRFRRRSPKQCVSYQTFLFLSIHCASKRQKLVLRTTRNSSWPHTHKKKCRERFHVVQRYFCFLAIVRRLLIKRYDKKNLINTGSDII